MSPTRHDRHWDFHPAVPTGDELAFGDRAADLIASILGSWRFLIGQTWVIVAWIFLNVSAVIFHWDPYPFILLNLLFSTQAAYSAPVLQMAANRKDAVNAALAAHDRRRMERIEAKVDQIRAHLQIGD